jgi:hypothetical protein
MSPNTRAQWKVILQRLRETSSGLQLAYMRGGFCESGCHGRRGVLKEGWGVRLGLGLIAAIVRACCVDEHGMVRQRPLVTVSKRTRRSNPELMNGRRNAEQMIGHMNGICVYACVDA